MAGKHFFFNIKKMYKQIKVACTALCPNGKLLAAQAISRVPSQDAKQVVSSLILGHTF